MNKKILIAIILVIAVFAVLLFLDSTNNKLTTNTVISKDIEKVDFKKYLSEKHESADYQPQSEKCEVGSTTIDSVIYGDITNDGIEEAVVNYRNCWNGTGGGNSEVYKLDSQGGLIAISPDYNHSYPAFPAETDKAEKYREIFKGFGGHAYYGIKDSKLVLSFPVYKGDDPNCCPSGGESTVVYNWNGNAFVFDSVTTKPPIDP